MLLRSVFVLGALFTASALAVADQVVFEDGPNQIVLETATRDYLVRYVGDDGTLKTIRWTPPPHNIDASVRSRFKQVEDDAIRYTYAIQNNRSSPQPIIDAKILVSEADKKAVTVPNSWEPFIVENPNEGETGYWIIWSQYRTGIPAGQSQGGYAVVKRDLPGIGRMWLSGAATMIAFSDEGPHGKMAEYLEGDFFFAHKDGVPYLAAIPRINVPTPYDAAMVLTNIQKHLDQDLVAMKLVEPALVAELDRRFEMATAAAKSGNSAALKADLKEARKILKRERQDIDKDDDRDSDDKEKTVKYRIDKLAARVLDFDLEYVEKRVKGDKE
jgi:hypothetical protein